MRPAVLLTLLWPALFGCGGGPLLSIPSILQIGPNTWFDAAQNLVYVEDARGTFCGGIMISSTSLLTAEHCLKDRVRPIIGTQAKVQSGAIQIGELVVGGSQVLTDLPRLSRDVAIVQTRVPVVGLATIPRLRRSLKGGEIGHAWVPQLATDGTVTILQIACPVLGQAGVLVEFSCNTSLGASGSPVFIEENGGLTLAGILTARGQGENTGVAVGLHASVVDRLRF